MNAIHDQPISIDRRLNRKRKCVVQLVKGQITTLKLRSFRPER